MSNVNIKQDKQKGERNNVINVPVVNAILECPYSATQKCHSIFKK